MTRVLLHFRHRNLSKGIVSWVSSCEAMRRSADLVIRAVARLVQLGVARAWGSWSATAAELMSKLQLVRRAMGHIASSKLVKMALTAWHDGTLQHTRAMERVQAVVHRLQNQQLSRGLGEWVESWRLSLQQVRMMDRLQHVIIQLNVAWMAWLAGIGGPLQKSAAC